MLPLPEPGPDATARAIPEIDGHFRVLFERAPLPYLVTDSCGVIRQANRAAAVLLKRPAELLVKQPLDSFVPLEQRRAFRDGLYRLPLIDRAHDWRLTIVPYAGAPVEVAAHIEVTDGDRRDESVMCWLLQPADADASDLRAF